MNCAISSLLFYSSVFQLNAFIPNNSVNKRPISTECFSSIDNIKVNISLRLSIIVCQNYLSTPSICLPKFPSIRLQDILLLLLIFFCYPFIFVGWWLTCGQIASKTWNLPSGDNNLTLWQITRVREVDNIHGYNIPHSHSAFHECVPPLPYYRNCLPTSHWKLQSWTLNPSFVRSYKSKDYSTEIAVYKWINDDIVYYLRFVHELHCENLGNFTEFPPKQIQYTLVVSRCI